MDGKPHVASCLRTLKVEQEKLTHLFFTYSTEVLVNDYVLFLVKVGLGFRVYHFWMMCQDCTVTFFRVFGFHIDYCNLHLWVKIQMCFNFAWSPLVGQRRSILECGGAICDALVIHNVRIDLKIARSNCHILYFVFFRSFFLFFGGGGFQFNARVNWGFARLHAFNCCVG